MEPTRRFIAFTLPLLAAARALHAQSGNGGPLASFAKQFEELPLHNHGGNESRAILNGTTASGDSMEVHETTLAPGGSPHAPHKHRHEELFLIVRGKLEVTIAGRTTTIDAGGAAFVHSGEMHGVRNTETTPTQYFVVAIGNQTSST